MKNIIVVSIVCLISFSACTQKEYSAEAIFKEWQKEGDSAPSLLEITSLCNKDKDAGHSDSTVCKVYGRADALIFAAKFKARFTPK